MLEALVDRQDHHLARVAQLAASGCGRGWSWCRGNRSVVVEDLLDDAGDFHG